MGKTTVLCKRGVVLTLIAKNMDGIRPRDGNGAGVGNYTNGGIHQRSGFLDQLQDGPKAGPSRTSDHYDMKLGNKNQHRNRGNYRCSKCGEPKKGHVCPLVPSTFKCNRCNLPKKSCGCVAPTLRTIGVQVELDQDMTTRVLDLSVQGVMEFQKTVAGCSTPPIVRD